MLPNLFKCIWPTYVDADLPISREQRKAIHREAWRLWIANRWNLALYLLLPAAYLAALPVARGLAGVAVDLLGLGGLAVKLLRVAALVVLPASLFIFGGMVFQRFRFAPLVYRVTRDHGFSVCPRCGYWLKGLAQETSCPECGASIEPPSEGWEQ